MTASAARPTGREQVVAAVLDAAGRLFADRGPAAVSLRDVARAADVNVGLIHRHIGTKDDLVAAVLRRPAFEEGIEARFPDMTLAEILRAVLSDDVDVVGFSRIQAQAILDGYDLVALGVDLPAVRFAFEQLRTRLPERDAKVRAAALAAFVTGWRTLGTGYLRVLGVEDDEAVARALAPVVDALADA